jgi:glutathione synthase/RimK-type ligase-like ATP-grasp enzyme
VTNSPADFLDFYRQHNGQVVYKQIGAAFIQYAGDKFIRFTEVVSKRDVAYAQSVRSCPLIFQAYVPKRVELRVTVVGREVFPAEIHSQQTNQTRHDWRRYDFGKTLYQPHKLPSEVRERCLELVERLGLCYGAIDLVVTPDGRYVFLEINPNGQYLWVELATGMPISEAICDLLLSEAPADDADELSGASLIGERL